MKFKNAVNYNHYAIAQKEAADSLIRNLTLVLEKENHSKHFDSGLEIGCGNGLVTELFLKNFQCPELTVNDLFFSKPMETLTHLVGCIEQLELPRTYDIIYSSSALQWMKDLPRLLQKLHQKIAPKGFLAVSLFTQGTLFQLEGFTKQGLAYKTNDEFFHLVQNIFKLTSHQEGSVTLKYDTLFDLLDSLKQTGVNNLNGSFKLTKETYRNMERYFLQEFNGFELTYNYAVAIASK